VPNIRSAWPSPPAAAIKQRRWFSATRLHSQLLITIH